MIKRRGGFTLLELMIAVAILGFLTAIAVVTFNNMIQKSIEGHTKGNLATLRSALSIYYGDNEERYPLDDLRSLSAGGKYLLEPPLLRTPPYHEDSRSVTTEGTVSDTGMWSYDNDSSRRSWGAVHVGCLHRDVRGEIWSSY